MPGWNNVDLKQRRKSISVRKVLNRGTDFVIVLLSNNKQQKLNAANLPAWAQVQEGTVINLSISETVTTAWLEPGTFQKSFQEKVQKFFNGLQKKVSGLFFMWVCEQCDAMGYITYEEGDDPETIASRVEEDHEKTRKPKCNKSLFTVYDHRGVPQEKAGRIIAMRSKKKQAAAPRT